MPVIRTVNYMLSSPVTVGDRLKILRKEAGLTASQLGEKLGTSQPAITQWETGKRTPRIEAIEAYSRHFSVSTDWILKGAGMVGYKTIKRKDTK